MSFLTKAIVICACILPNIECKIPVITDFILQVYKFDDKLGIYSVTNESYLNENTVILDPESEIRLTCVGNVYMEIQLPSQIADNRMTITNKRFFENGILEYESALWGVVDFSNTGFYTCKADGNTATKMLYIFVKGSSAFTSKQSDNQRIVINDGIIPCRVTDPSISVLLYQQHQHHNTHVKVPYDPKVGFRLDGKHNVPGVYMCKSENPLQHLTFHIENSQGVHYQPKEGVVSAEEGEFLTFKCSRERHREEIIAYRVDPFGSPSSSTRTKTTFEYKGSNGEKGNISCIAEDGKVLHTWLYRITKKPELEFVSWTGSVLCNAGSRDIQFYSLKCENPNVCRWRRFNVNEDVGCFGFVYSGSLCKPGTCSRLFQSHQSGLLLCIVDGVRISHEFFTGLNRNRYLDWKDAPTDALIRLDAVDSVIYNPPGQKTYFYCEAVSFLFMDNLVFGLKYRNESVIKLPEESLETDPSTINRTIPSIINSGVKISVTEDVIGVFCFAPWINSTESFYNTSITFTVKDVKKPILRGESMEFTEGDEGRSLSCLVEGQPTPELSWHLEINDAASFKNYKDYEVKTDKGINLNFPKITKGFEGTYVCHAKNSEGEARRTFKVKVHSKNNYCHRKD